MSGESRRLAELEANAREFSAVLERGRRRTDALDAAGAVPPPEALPAILDELRAHQEELSVAAEELRAQLDELAASATRARADRDRYRALFDQSPDGYFLTDALGVIRDANIAAAGLVNVEPRFLIGKPLAALVDVADARLLREHIALLRKKQSSEVELRLQPRGGDPLWLEMKVAVLQDGSGLLWGARDMQARHVASGLLSRKHDELQGVDSRRLAELERANRDKEELLVRERRLREELVMADVAKDRLIAVLSHDLRGPLHGVLGWTQLLRRETLDGKARDRALATIEQNARAQVRLLDELLDISRIASDSVQLERVAIDLSLLAQVERDAVAVGARERGVVIECAIAPGIVVTGDRARLQHLVRTLLTRSLGAVARGGRVELRVEADAMHARVVVRDDGRGFAPERASVLFDLVGEGSTDGLSGDAVGLYIVRRIAELHEGTVVAESAGVGLGSQLTVTLALPSMTRRPPPLVATGALTGVRVLVVDDDDDARDLMMTVLEMAGAIVAMAASGAVALEVFDSFAPHAVVTDLSMPGMSGQEMMRELRTRAARVPPAFVLISGYSGAPDDEAAGGAFDAQLTKPVDVRALVATLERLATERR